MRALYRTGLSGARYGPFCAAGPREGSRQPTDVTGLNWGMDVLLVAPCRTEDSRLSRPCYSERPLHRRGQMYSVVIN